MSHLSDHCIIVLFFMFYIMYSKAHSSSILSVESEIDEDDFELRGNVVTHEYKNVTKMNHVEIMTL